MFVDLCTMMFQEPGRGHGTEKLATSLYKTLNEGKTQVFM
jgi:hypothetical protein